MTLSVSSDVNAGDDDDDDDDEMDPIMGQTWQSCLKDRQTRF